jgi:hypothetical protein
MTPKRLRLIAQIIRQWHQADQTSRTAIANELESHAEDLENWGAEPPLIRLKEPRPSTVFNDIAALPKASEGRR